MLALPPNHRLRLRGIYSLDGLGRALTFFRSYGTLVAAALLLSGVFWVDQVTAAHLGAESVARLAALAPASAGQAQLAATALDGPDVPGVGGKPAGVR